jgi:hypothetical protein
MAERWITIDRDRELQIQIDEEPRKVRSPSLFLHAACGR